MFFIMVRVLNWALARKPLKRHLRPVNSAQLTLMDALDLVSNLRGHGWDWSHGVYIPQETRPSNHTGFILHTVLSAVANAFAVGILHTALRSFFPVELRTLPGGPTLDETFSPLHRVTCFLVTFKDIPGPSIFDESLPPYLQFLRSSIITIFVLLCVYAGLQAFYDLCTLFGVLALGQDPAQWPPFFDAPWRAISVSDFWGRRWHQWLRNTLLVLGGYPLSFVFGRAGMVMGVFLASAVCHSVWLHALSGNGEFWRMLVGYGMMGLGIIIEHLFKYVTGRKVRGLFGWAWTLVWVLLWGNVIVDGYARASSGMVAAANPTYLVLPVRKLVEYLVTGFDNWLHAISSM